MTIPTLEPSAVSGGMIECEYSVTAKYYTDSNENCFDFEVSDHYYGPLKMDEARELASFLTYCNFDEVKVQALN